MAVTLPTLPQPPVQTAKRFNPDGTPTRVQVDYEAALTRYLKALAAIAGAS